MTENSTTTMVTGSSSGQVTYQKRCHGRGAVDGGGLVQLGADGLQAGQQA